MVTKLRILYIDDKPNSYKSYPKDVELSAEYVPYFDLVWLQNAKEARYLLDAFDLLGARCPDVLGEARLPPELLIFDYALTQGGKLVRDDKQPSNPLPALRKLLAEQHLPLPEAAGDGEYGPDTGAVFSKDRTGCYVGVALARAFGTYPCGALPTTAHVDTGRSDAAFFEWFNQRYFLNKFEGDQAHYGVTQLPCK